ncbi:MAG: ATP-binding protein [Lachnospiraceae bacterium]|nr:ATP-binding protein [Lachnospiraceae bacterium]
MKNPFAINFGIVPYQYIERQLIIEEIVDEMNADIVQNSCFMLTGIRGSGKTVTMTAIEKQLKEDKKWIVVDLSTERDMLQSLVAKLYDRDEFVRKFAQANLNLTGFGIGVAVEKKPPIADIESALEIILKEVKKSNRKLLVSVDEVTNNNYMKQLVSTFQIMIRQELPIYLLMAGLYENVHNLENEETLTFLYRAPKYEMEPLNITLVKMNYKKIFNISDDDAMELALATKGYPFAYQVLGKYVWESDEKKLTEEVIAQYDMALAKYVYDKIWSELSKTDQWYLSLMANRSSMDVSELLEKSKKKKNEFSQYRSRLRDKGILDVSTRGVLRMRLPRFENYVQYQVER